MLNVSARPILALLKLSLFIVPLGLLTFVLNALMLWLTSAVSNALGLGFRVEGFGAAFIRAFVVTVINFLLSRFVVSGARARGACHPHPDVMRASFIVPAFNEKEGL